MNRTMATAPQFATYYLKLTGSQPKIIKANSRVIRHIGDYCHGTGIVKLHVG